MPGVIYTKPPSWRVLPALLLGIALVLLIAPAASAQESGPLPQAGGLQEETPASIQQLRLQVMPEYDDPRVLVIGQGRLGGGMSGATREVSFWIPEGAQVNLIIGMGSTSAELVSQPYTLEPDPLRPGWALLTSEFDNAHFFYEYYYAGLESDPAHPERISFNFIFSSPLPVESILVELQQPLEAVDFSSQPRAASQRQDPRYGFSYHLLERGSLSAGQDLAVQVSYTKSNPAPSIARPAPGMPPRAAGLAGGGALDMPLGLGAFARWICSMLVLLLGIGGTAAAVILSRRSQLEPVFLIEARPDFVGYACQVCGQLSRPGACYCHRCGSRVKIETHPGSDPRGQVVGVEASPASEEGR
jgi:hypothetical protein